MISKSIIRVFYNFQKFKKHQKLKTVFENFKFQEWSHLHRAGKLSVISNEPFPLPDHKYVFESNPMLLFDHGMDDTRSRAAMLVGMWVKKLTTTKFCPGARERPHHSWRLTEEDRYTRRNWTIRGCVMVWAIDFKFFRKHLIFLFFFLSVKYHTLIK